MLLYSIRSEVKRGFERGAIQSALKKKEKRRLKLKFHVVHNRLKVRRYNTKGVYKNKGKQKEHLC